jgi:hypothetical protein
MGLKAIANLRVAETKQFYLTKARLGRHISRLTEVSLKFGHTLNHKPRDLAGDGITLPRTFINYLPHVGLWPKEGRLGAW